MEETLSAAKGQNRFLKLWLSFLIFLLPLFFIPSFFDAYGLPKIALLLGGTLIGWLIFLGEKFFRKEKVNLLFPRWFWPALVLAALFVISSLFVNPTAATRINALSGKTAVIWGGFLLAFLIAQASTFNPQLPLVGSSIILSLVFIGQYLGLLKKWLTWPFLASAVWSPTGTIFSALVLILASFIYLLTLVIRYFRSQEKLNAAPFLALGGMAV